MKKIMILAIISYLSNVQIKAQITMDKTMNGDTIKIASHFNRLSIAMLHRLPKTMAGNAPVLFLHGSSFPSALSFGFRMSGISWMDNLSAHDYESYALDFLGYGEADRYPNMAKEQGLPTGRAMSAYLDADKAVNYILKRTGHQKLILIGHSWGGSVAALYAENFPDKVEKLILFAPITAKSAYGKPELIERPYESLTPEARVQSMIDLTPKNEINQLEPEMFTQWKNLWLQSDMVANKADKTTVRFPAGPSQDVEDLQHGKSYYNPAKIVTPTLLIRGEWDSYPSNDDALAFLKALPDKTPNKYAVVPQGTHVMHLEKSRYQLYEETLKFIAASAGSKIHDNSIAVIFEVMPNDRRKQDYLDIAAKLKPELEKIDGFISIERFQSLSDPKKILSLSFWRDEKSILTWRNLELHRQAQNKGRNGIFKDYHLRIAHVVRDYGMFDRREAPADSKTYHGASDR